MTTNRNPPLIAHVIYRLGTGGLENGLINIINRTPAERYSHAVICLTDVDRFSQRITKPGVTVISLHKREGKDFVVYWRLWKALNEMKPQLIHTRNLAALEAQVAGFLVAGAKRVHGEHGRDVFDLDGRNFKYNLLRRLIRPLIHRYIAVSKDLRKWLMEIVSVPPSRVVQIYNGVDQQLFYPAKVRNQALAPNEFLPDRALVIGTVGRLAGVKDQATLVNAFSRAIELRPGIARRLRLIIAGDGPMRNDIEALVQKAGKSNLVWLTGDRDDVPDILRLMNVFVLPSLGEGISNTILEAMATALPVIATRVGGNPELVKEGVTGQLVPAADVEAMAHALLKYDDAPDLMRQHGGAGFNRVKNEFCWESTVAKYLSVYDELLAVG